jgi:hypothetical protein
MSAPPRNNSRFLARIVGCPVWFQSITRTSVVTPNFLVSVANEVSNLETPTKMDRVAGIQTGGSERAFDMYMKARYLGEQHPGYDVTFATGTPINGWRMVTAPNATASGGTSESRNRNFATIRPGWASRSRTMLTWPN